MNKAYKLIVFDWEGTVADTLGQVLNVIAIEAKSLGYGEVNFVQARGLVSLGLVRSLQKLFPNLSLHEQEQLLHAVQHHLVTKPQEVCFIPGAWEFIHQVYNHQIDVAIATNKGHHSLMKALHNSGLDRIFQVTRSAGEVPAKPCPQMLQEIMSVFDATAEDTVMIGDSVSDMEMARSIQVTAIGLDFYHQQEAALKDAGAVEVFDDYQLLAQYLNLPKP
jgi:phosphoglycolate phosphatase